MAGHRHPMRLTDDEIMSVKVDGVEIRARVRIWRALNEPANVLVERIWGDYSPSYGVCKFARMIWRDMLHYTPLGMVFYEADSTIQWSVTFDAIGHEARTGFIRPSYERLPVGSRFDDEIGRVMNIPGFRSGRRAA